MKYAILPLFFALMLCAQVTPEQFDTAMGTFGAKARSRSERV